MGGMRRGGSRLHSAFQIGSGVLHDEKPFLQSRVIILPPASLSVWPSVLLFVCPSVSLSMWLSVLLSVWLSVVLLSGRRSHSVYGRLSQSLCPSVSPSVWHFIPLSVLPSVCYSNSAKAGLSLSDIPHKTKSRGESELER